MNERYIKLCYFRIESPAKRGVKRSVSDMQETSVCDSPKEAHDESVKKKKKKKKHHKKDKDSFSDNSAQAALNNSQQISGGDTSNPRGSVSNMDTGGSFISVAGPGENQPDSSLTKKEKKKKEPSCTKLLDASLDSSTPLEKAVPGPSGLSGKKHGSKKDSAKTPLQEPVHGPSGKGGKKHGSKKNSIKTPLEEPVPGPSGISGKKHGIKKDSSKTPLEEPAPVPSGISGKRHMFYI